MNVFKPKKKNEQHVAVVNYKPKKAKKNSLYHREHVASFLMVLPAIVNFSVFILAPMIFALVISLCDFTLITFSFDNFGFQNYKDLFSKASLYGETFWMCVTNTLVYLIEVPIIIALGLFAAVLVSSKFVKANKVFRVLIYLPAVCSAVASNVIWREFFYNSDNELTTGLLNKLMGWNIYWLTDRGPLLTAIIFKNSINGMGGAMILYYAALCNVSQDYYEAADIDGANSWIKFWRITFPLLTPTTFYMLITRISSVLQSYADSTMFAAKDPGAQTVVYFVWDYGINEFNQSIASAASIVLGIAIMCVTVFQFRRSKKWVVEL